MSESTSRPGSSTVAKPTEQIKRPSLYRVVLHNDHYTTMDFVVHVLRVIFGKGRVEAVRIMLSVHQQGIGVAGVYPVAVAETKAAKVHKMAQEQGFPLRCSVEPE